MMSANGSDQSSTRRVSSLNMEVVVIVHAGRTTTSKAEARFGIIAKPKRKLITSETETAPQAFKMLLWQTLQRQQQLQKSPSAINIPHVSVS